MPCPVDATGGFTIDAVGAACRVTFTSNGTFVIPTGVTAVDVLLVGGGGGSSFSGAGGGGGGQVVVLPGAALAPGSGIDVTVGYGGGAGGGVYSPMGGAGCAGGAGGGGAGGHAWDGTGRAATPAGFGGGAGGGGAEGGSGIVIIQYTPASSSTSTTLHAGSFFGNTTLTKAGGSIVRTHIRRGLGVVFGAVVAGLPRKGSTVRVVLRRPNGTLVAQSFPVS